MAETTPEADWEGLALRECGEHLTTGRRAWCFDCSEWCYKSAPCRGCEIVELRVTAADGVVALSLLTRLAADPDVTIGEHEVNGPWMDASVPLTSEEWALLRRLTGKENTEPSGGSEHDQ